MPAELEQPERGTPGTNGCRAWACVRDCRSTFAPANAVTAGLDRRPTGRGSIHSVRAGGRAEARRDARGEKLWGVPPRARKCSSRSWSEGAARYWLAVKVGRVNRLRCSAEWVIRPLIAVVVVALIVALIVVQTVASVLTGGNAGPTTGPVGPEVGGTPIAIPALTAGLPMGRASRVSCFFFFANTYMPGVSHVAIYIGNGLQINAPTTREVVSVAPVFTGYWGAHYAGAHRVRIKRFNMDASNDDSFSINNCCFGKPQPENFSVKTRVY